MTGFLDSLFGMPVLRRVSETDQGPHRSATPESTHMLNITEPMPVRQESFITSTVIKITPDHARHLRDTAHFERQRKIAAENVNRLAHEMKAGRFIPGLQVYICVLPDGSEHIVNGNHTLEAVVKSDVSQVLTVTRAGVPDFEEAGRRYAVFDLQKTRTWSDSLRATGAGEEIPDANRAMAAVRLILDGFTGDKSRARSSRISVIDMLPEYEIAAKLFAASIKGAPTESSKMVRRAGVMAVALETCRYQPSLASEFWGSVAHDNGLVKGTPERALLGWLRNNKPMGGGSSQTYHAKSAALAWNAAFRGQERHFIKPNQMLSFFLLGTPHANGLRG